jgi:OmpA-OmpF porin, OOP family
MTATFKLILIVFFISKISFGQKLETVGGAVNTEFTELHPLIAPDGNTLYFVRVSHPSNNFGKEGSTDVWYSDLLNKSWTVARKMPNTVNKDQYNDLFSISPDGNTALIRGKYENGRLINEIGISVCKKKGVTWQQPQVLDIPKLDDMAKGQFLTAFMSNSQKVLILAFSEKKNSKADDLYFSIRDKQGKWSKPESLGAEVNSGDSDTTPFLASDDNTLYFASNRKGGEGGFDIWVTKRKNKSWTAWSKPLNMGKAVNSGADDLHYSIEASGEYAYLSSKNNAIGGKADIFKIRLKEEKKTGPEEAAITASDNNPIAPKKVEKEEAPSLTAPSTVVLISGLVKDQKTGRPIEARIVYEDLEDGEEIGVATSNPTTGEYKVSLPYGKRYAIRAEAKDFISISKNYDLTQKGTFKEIKGEDLFVAAIQTGTPILLGNIFFVFGKSDLEEASFYELDRMVQLLKDNNNMLIEVQGHTDNVGSTDANQKLSQQRADAVRNYMLSKKVSPERVKSNGFGESKPIAPNTTTEGQAKNRRVEFEILRK